MPFYISVVKCKGTHNHITSRREFIAPKGCNRRHLSKNCLFGTILVVKLKNSTLWWEGRWPSWSGIGTQVVTRTKLDIFKLLHFTTISCHCINDRSELSCRSCVCFPFKNKSNTCILHCHISSHSHNLGRLGAGADYQKVFPSFLCTLNYTLF